MRRIIRKIRPVPTNCRFCKQHEAPTYRKWEVLSHFVTERGKMMPKITSGLCAKHQRKLATEVKRARHIALLPYVVRPL